MATEKQVKQAIKQVLDSEYMNKMVTFDKGWKFKVKSYNVRTRSRFIPKDERDDYGCDVDANKFFIIEFNNAKDELVAYDGQCTDFGGSAYVDKLEWVAIIATDGKFMVYINNPGCPVDADGCPIFTKEHPQQQWVFGYYESFNRALNRAVAITKARKYPKPIEIW